MMKGKKGKEPPEEKPGVEAMETFSTQIIAIENARLYEQAHKELKERKLAEEALKESEERYRDLVEKSGIAISIDDKEGNFKYINEKFAEIFGYTLEEMRKQSINSIVHPDDLKMVMNYHQGRIQGKRVPSRYEFKGIRKDGSHIFLEVDAVKLMEGEASVGSRAYMWDITERKKSEEKIINTLSMLRKAEKATIQALNLTVEMRDPSTAGHQRRVADLARSIAIEMGLPEDKIDAIRMAASIHDLGKIAVPTEILSKPGRINDNEFNLVKNHSQVGYNILKTIEFPWPVAQIVHQHHERMDGSGYPHGLSGEDILIEARIIGVGDVIEAMVSHRPYRSAFTLEEALEETSKNRGLLYDPDVVDACLSLFKKKKYKFKER